MSCTLCRGNRSVGRDENRAWTGPAGDASAESCRSASVRPAKRRSLSLSLSLFLSLSVSPAQHQLEAEMMMAPRLRSTVVVSRTQLPSRRDLRITTFFFCFLFVLVGLYRYTIPGIGIHITSKLCIILLYARSLVSALISTTTIKLDPLRPVFKTQNTEVPAQHQFHLASRQNELVIVPRAC